MFTVKNNSRGFTLIELLVVITIIGILATGGVAVFTTQIQKARDATRIQDQETMKSAIEQAYQDSSTGEYPAYATLTGTVFKAYLQGRSPKDPKSGQLCYASGATKPACDYMYSVGQTNILNDSYNLSVAFENAGNATAKATNAYDQGSDDFRYEVGTNIKTATFTATFGSGQMIK